jgi:aspartate/methionine/tyrosine aminotransferase
MTPSILQPPRFQLEDFHREFEHMPGVANLSTSDTSPWGWHEALQRCPAIGHALDSTRWQYPDTERELIPSIARLYRATPETALLATNGAAEGIFLALSAVRHTSAGQTVVAVPTPAYGAFAGASELLGYHVERYRYEANSDWHIDEAEILRAAGCCDVVVINTPHNPTGHMMASDLIAEVASRLQRRNGWLLLDEVFQWAHDGPLEPISSNVVSIRSLSKLYGLPGMRLGWIAAPEALVDVIRTLQQYSTAAIGALASKLGCAILPSLKSFARPELLESNRTSLRDWASTHADVVHVVPFDQGTTAIIEFKSRLEEREIFERLRLEGVILAPGKRCFGEGGPRPWFRLGYGVDEGSLAAGLAAIQRTLPAIGV